MTASKYRLSCEALLHRDHYSPAELSDLLGIGEHVICHDARTGRLRAYVINHHILDIRREDALVWLQRRHDELQNVRMTHSQA
jgi:hypothetical protein